MDHQNDDRRVYQRFPTLLSGRIKHPRSSVWEAMALKNASAQGAAFCMKESLQINDKVSLLIEFLGVEEPLILKGEVVWVKSSERDFWEVGIRLDKSELMKVHWIIQMSRQGYR